MCGEVVHSAYELFACGEPCWYALMLLAHRHWAVECIDRAADKQKW